MHQKCGKYGTPGKIRASYPRSVQTSGNIMSGRCASSLTPDIPGRVWNAPYTGVLQSRSTRANRLIYYRFLMAGAELHRRRADFQSVERPSSTLTIGHLRRLLLRIPATSRRSSGAINLSSAHASESRRPGATVLRTPHCLTVSRPQPCRSSTRRPAFDTCAQSSVRPSPRAVTPVQLQWRSLCVARSSMVLLPSRTLL
jgi:hypothetical protein